MNTTSTAIAKTNKQVVKVVTAQEKELDLNWKEIKEHYAPEATDTEFAIFCDACKANNIDPRKKEVYFVKYNKNSPGQTVTAYSIYLKRAERSGLLNGWKVEIIKDDVVIIGAKCTIWRKDWKEPFEWEISAREFDKHQSTWNQMKSFMLKKVCIAQAFRMCFPEEVASLPYIEEEVKNITAQSAIAPPKNAIPLIQSPVAQQQPPVRQMTADEINAELDAQSETPVETEVIVKPDTPQVITEPEVKIEAPKGPEAKKEPADKPKPKAKDEYSGIRSMLLKDLGRRKVNAFLKSINWPTIDKLENKNLDVIRANYDKFKAKVEAFGASEKKDDKANEKKGGE